MIELLTILILILIALEIYNMATIADANTKLDTIQSNILALQQQIAAATSQTDIDALNVRLAALVTASTPPTPAT